MKEYVWGLGRRKTSVARVRICQGKGTILVNKIPYDQYFDVPSSRESVELPLDKLEIRNRYDIWINVNGGGKVAQGGAVMLGISRALIKENESYEAKLRDCGLLTRDPRMKERKKPGQKGARARYQFSKR